MKQVTPHSHYRHAVPKEKKKKEEENKILNPQP